MIRTQDPVIESEKAPQNLAKLGLRSAASGPARSSSSGDQAAAAACLPVVTIETMWLVVVFPHRACAPVMTKAGRSSRRCRSITEIISAMRMTLPSGVVWTSISSADDEAWAQVTAKAPSFLDYTSKTDRQLPVLRLTPVPEGQA